MSAGLAEVFPLKVDILLLLLPSPEGRDTVALQGRCTKEKFQSSLEHFYWVIHEHKALMIQSLLHALHPNTTFLEVASNTNFGQAHN